MEQGPALVVVGATGAVGRQVLSHLGTRADLWSRVVPVASDRGYGRTVRVCGADVPVLPLTPEVFEHCDVAIFATPEDVAAAWVPVAVNAGLIVVDNSEAFGRDHDVPLVVPEINRGRAAGSHPRVVSGPGGVALTVVNVLNTLHRQWGLSEVVMSAYVAASLQGEAGVAELYAEAAALGGNPSVGQTPGDVRRFLGDLDRESPFPAPLAFNLVPWVGDMGDGVDSGTELRTAREIRRILDLPHLPLSLTCVQVPVVRAHSATLHVTLESEVTRAGVVQALTEDNNGVVVLDDPANGEWPTPTDVVGTDPTFVGRIRHDPQRPRVVDLFVCTDNLRRGSALNLLELAEIAVADRVAQSARGPQPVAGAY